MEKTKCCICGKEIKGYGNNPWPVKKEGLCCDIPARIKNMYKRG